MKKVALFGMVCVMSVTSAHAGWFDNLFKKQAEPTTLQEACNKDDITAICPETLLGEKTLVQCLSENVKSLSKKCANYVKKSITDGNETIKSAVSDKTEGAKQAIADKKAEIAEQKELKTQEIADKKAEISTKKEAQKQVIADKKAETKALGAEIKDTAKAIGNDAKETGNAFKQMF